MIRLLDILRKWNQPFSVINTMSEGWVEDFFGAWSAEDCQQDVDVFNPDENWHLIFPVP